MLGTILLTSLALANPEGGVVTSGSATITQTQTTTTVQQTSQQAIINWQSFNIGAGEKTQFIQPNQNSVALNRINPNQGASQIFGELTSNGKIILVNQAGIFFGAGAQVNVGGIIASTSDISDANFLAGKYIFDTPSSFNGSIINQGTINVAQYGLAALMGTSVENGGLIQAQLGNIVLASGNKFTVSFAGDGLINFSVDEAASHAGVDQNGHSLKNGVLNTGTLIANGGTILLTGKAAEGVVDNVINMSGVAQAQSVYGHDGDIILAGDDENTVEVNGLLDASGTQSGLSGGTVKILGENISLLANTDINVSGDTGGGTILVGGNFHGAGPEQDALSTYISAGAILNADAITSGNGGQVAVWSNNDTEFHGTITARGGSENGNGGYVETSGGYLDISGGTVNTLASRGTTGTWLLDPTDVDIVSGSTDSNATYGSGTYQPTNGANSTSTIGVNNLIAALNSTNVLITTSAASGSGGSGNGDITVSAAINWSAATTLTLSAYRNINVNAAISNSSGGSLTLRADNTGTGVGTIAGLQSGGSGSLSFTGNNSAVNVYYNPTSFPTPDGTLGTGIFTNVTVSGTGSTFTPYMLVNSQTELQNMSSNLTGNYALAKNLVLSGTFTPIGSASTPFMGSFDGQGYSISGLTINSSSTDVGLFADLGNSSTPYTGEIQDVTFVDPSVASTNTSSYGYVGTVTGELYGASATATYINNVSVQGGSVIGSYSDSNSTHIEDYLNGTGGLVGFLNNGVISNSSNSAAVNGVAQSTQTDVGGMAGIANNSQFTNDSNSGAIESGRAYMGGIVGLSEGTLLIDSSFNTGAIGGYHQIYTQAGGLLGGSVSGSGTISNSYNTGTVSGFNSGNDVGGLVGLDYAVNISNSYNKGVVTAGGNSGYAGGLIGLTYTDTTITDAWNTASVTITSTGAVGGLIGSANGTTNISGSYNTGSISDNGATNSQIAGLVGNNFSGTITNSYNAGSITSGSGGIVGGLVGQVGNATSSTITNSYNTGTITDAGKSIVGGLVGNADEEWGSGALAISNSYNTGALSSSGSDLGGLIGLSNMATISSSYNTGTLTDTSNTTINAAGGLIGSGTLKTNGYLISNSYNSGNIVTSNSTSGDQVGGLVGTLGGFNGNNSTNAWNEIQGSYNSGNISATSANAEVGGLAGTMQSNNRVSSSSTDLIQTSFNTGNITATGAGSYVGGIVGQAILGSGAVAVTNTLTNVYNLGSLSNSSRGNTGGLVGYANQLTINTSYNAGSVSGGTTGGLIGNGTTGTVTVNSSYWDSVTSGQSSSFVSGITGAMTTTDFENATLASLGFSSSAWQILSTYEYPLLVSFNTNVSGVPTYTPPPPALTNQQITTAVNVTTQATSSVTNNTSQNSVTNTTSAVITTNTLTQTVLGTDPTSQSITLIGDQQSSDDSKKQQSQSFGACAVQ